jgi:hypothetical protein
MTEDHRERDALIQALITEAVSLAAMFAVLWALSHKTEIEHAWWKVQTRRGRQAAGEARMLREVRRDISRMEHPEAGT